LPPFTFEGSILVARGQGRGLKAGSAGGEDPMKGHFPAAEGDGPGWAICAPQDRFRPDRWKNPCLIMPRSTALPPGRARPLSYGHLSDFWKVKGGKFWNAPMGLW